MFLKVNGAFSLWYSEWCADEKQPVTVIWYHKQLRQQQCSYWQAQKFVCRSTASNFEYRRLCKVYAIHHTLVQLLSFTSTVMQWPR